MKKRILLITGVLICLIGLGLLSISYASNISNPFHTIRGVLKLESNNTQIEKISDNPLILIGKEPTDIIEYMNKQGYTLETQEGSGYFFTKNKKTTILTSQKFTKRYITWRTNNQRFY